MNATHKTLAERMLSCTKYIVFGAALLIGVPSIYYVGKVSERESILKTLTNERNRIVETLETKDTPESRSYVFEQAESIDYKLRMLDNNGHLDGVSEETKKKSNFWYSYWGEE